MNNIKSIYYHNPAPIGFERMIVYYKNRGYRFITLSELYSILTVKRVITEKLVFISLDDGWKGNLRLLPIIEKHQIPVCIFVATQPIEDGNYWWEYVKNEIGLKHISAFKELPHAEFYERLGELKKRNKLERSSITKAELIKLSKHPFVTIQSHTVNHPILTNTPDKVLNMELSDSKKHLEEITGSDIYAFSYPNGSLTDREVSVCEKYYKLAFTTEQRHIKCDDNLFLLPRYALTGQFYRDLLKVLGIWKILKKMSL